MIYRYLGDRFTDPVFKNVLCQAIKKYGKCIKGKNGNMLVRFENGKSVVVMARLLRKLKPGEAYKYSLDKFKASEPYKNMVDTLTKHTYTPKQPYVDNVIERIFNEAWHLGRNN